MIGAGVTGLSAIQTARSLGANVKAFDSRFNTKEQVESLGAEFVKINIVEDSIGAGIIKLK
jgi:NAD/NADP transhydrogenase alpha subunit